MSFNAKDMTQGGQIASMRIRMFSQIANIMLYCLFIFFWILVGLVLWVKISWQTFVNGCIYWWCTTLEGMRDLIRSQPVYEIQYYGKTFRMNAAQVLHDKYMIWCGEQLWSAFVLATVVALVICLITFFVVSWILGRQGKQQSENEVTGGRQLTDNPKDVARMLKKDGKDSDIEHKFQHQNDSLSCIPGCSLLSIKSALTLFPSNHSSHVSPAGVMIRVRPTAITSTRFTFSGNATAFGSLTAWLRLLRNTVVSIICLLMWICLVYIHCGIDAGICQRDIRL